MTHAATFSLGVFAVLLLPSLNATAQTVAEKAPAIERFAFKTNAFEWLCTIPNFGIEFDLSGKPWNHSTLSLSSRFRPALWQERASWCVMNLFDVKGEYRYYTPGKKFTRYYGGYAAYDSFSVKLSETGHQGSGVDFGFTFGWVFTVHEYKKGAVDMEIGGSVGMHAGNDNAYRNNENGGYTAVPEQSTGFHLTPWPVVNEVRAAFIWRRTPTSGKYRGSNPATKALSDARKDVDARFASISGEECPDADSYRQLLDSEAASIKTAVTDLYIDLDNRGRKSISRYVDRKCKASLKAFEKDLKKNDSDAAQ